MNLYKLKCIIVGGYDDKVLKRHVENNEEIIATEERAKVLLDHNAVEIVEIMKPVEKEENIDNVIIEDEQKEIIKDENVFEEKRKKNNNFKKNKKVSREGD